MPLNQTRARQLLKEFNFKSLFIEELGWDTHTAAVEVNINGQKRNVQPVAHKRGMVAYVCPTANGERLPEYSTRRKIEQQVARAAHEHLIIFTDASHSTQVWQWVKREPGKPAACREHTYHNSQPGDALLQKLQAIAFTLNEEESLTLIDVTRRTRTGFDVERVTKKFYDQFQKEHSKFLGFIDGIVEGTDREWYASVMLNRLMFVYFIQRKGFLDGDENYLRNRLSRCQQEKGRDKFYSFYRYFLLRLFHEGFGKRPKDRAADLEKLLGKIPYLNGGFFEQHQIELHYDGIQIPDKAFERIFDYFDQYQWHLDERPLCADNEINPDVLGFIFEKYINQKQMGAYYTKEDITEYISKNTVLPYLFDAARAKCRVAFERQSESAANPTVFDHLANDPNRYIYPAVRHGIDCSLPSEIKAGLQDFSARIHWNKSAPPDFALPTETWREVVNRREWCEELRSKLTSGSVREINDLIRLNLDLRQFTQDVVEQSEGPELLRAFWHALERVTILDPTCGSGAFLFAALNILEPLYEACLERMEAFVTDLDRSDDKHRPEKFSDFRRVLERVDAHPNRRYFIFKSIILNNLFGVDIMEEAVEICKLRLFLKLAAQVEPDKTKENLGIEPLPDIDFNIRAGNTLVGYATADEVRNRMTQFGDGQMRLGVVDEFQSFTRFNEKLLLVDAAFRSFRHQQTELGGSVTSKDKAELTKKLKALEAELNGYLAGEYGVNPNNKTAFTKWLKTHQPFHWFIEFYGIISTGGFDAIIGNPPYIVNTPEKVSYTIKRELFRTYDSKNLYAFVTERSLQLAHRSSGVGLIVQLTALSAEKMKTLQDLVMQRGLLLTPAFPRRPESIFDGVEMPVTILLSRHGQRELFTTRIGRFYTEERPSALSLIRFSQHELRFHGHRIGKLGTQMEAGLFKKLIGSPLSTLTTASSSSVLYYQEACRYWVKACKGYPHFRRNGEKMAPPHGRTMFLRDEAACCFAACLMNSSLFYWFYSAFSDCEHINDALIRSFPLPQKWENTDWKEVEARLARSLAKNSQRKTINTKQGHRIEYDELDASKSKDIIDEVDALLADHYGLTATERDFIVNYDIKYRAGAEDVVEK
jgi:hypothetical protein